MQTAIIVIWSLGLIVALIATVVILKQVMLVLRTLQGIHTLSTITLDAARGIAANVDPLPSLEPAHEPMRDFAAAVSALRGSIERLQRKLDKGAK